jgi:hypothetical protein
MTTKYQATCPDGTIVKRKTLDRTYTHVLVVKGKYGKPGWSAWGWIGRPDLIAGKQREAERYGFTRDNQVVLAAETV